jgi:hypothetical protein
MMVLIAPMQSDLTPEYCRIMRTNWSRADRLCGLSGNLQNSAERSPSFSYRAQSARLRAVTIYARWRWLSHSRASRCLHATQANVQGGHHGTTRSKGGARDRLTTVTVWLPAFRTPAPWIVRVGRTVCCQPTPLGNDTATYSLRGATMSRAAQRQSAFVHLHLGSALLVVSRHRFTDPPPSPEVLIPVNCYRTHHC